MSPVLLSQNDPRWKNIPLGTSRSSIGQGGCTITCIAMKFGLDPKFVNERLNAVDGFAPSQANNPFEPEKNLVIWNKLSEALPGVKFEYKYYTYDNEKVLQNLPCLVEVNGAPIGGFRHWVLFVGNHQIFDPWDGKVKPTSTYQPISFVVLSGQVQQVVDGVVYKTLDLTNRESMKAAVDVWYDVVISKLYVRKEDHEVLTRQMEVLQEQNKELSGKLSTLASRPELTVKKQGDDTVTIQSTDTKKISSFWQPLMRFFSMTSEEVKS